MHLLLMSCSAKKANTTEKVAAKDLYRGVFFSVLNKALREYPELSGNIYIVIISAKYGLLTSDEIIKTYDLKMTPQIARLQKESNTKKIRAIINTIHPEDLTVLMGKTYLQSINLTQLPLPAKLINGKIGVMLHEFKSWLTGLRGGDYFGN